MEIKIFTNSVGIRVQPSTEPILRDLSFCNIIGGKVYFAKMSTDHMYLLKHSGLKDDDIVITNYGINDCIFRKDRSGQRGFMKSILGEAIKRNDELTIKIATDRLEFIENKDDNVLFQFLSFDEFARVLDETFPLIKRGVVLSVVHFDPASSIIGYAYNDMKETNRILKEKADKYELVYIDLFDCKNPPETYNDVHLTGNGHQYIADQILAAINGWIDGATYERFVCKIKV